MNRTALGSLLASACVAALFTACAPCPCTFTSAAGAAGYAPPRDDSGKFTGLGASGHA